MPNVLIRSMLFLSSYFPLTLIFFFLFFEQQPIWAIVVLIIGLSGLIFMVLYFFQFAPRLGSIQERIIFFETIRRVAKEMLDTIRATVPVQNFDDFARDCEAHLAKLEKLRNIAANPTGAKSPLKILGKVQFGRIALDSLNSHTVSP